jgi:hypothetical protein
MVSMAATMVAQMAPQSVRVILMGAQPLQASEPPSEAIPAMFMPGDAIAMGMRRICTPAKSARIKIKLAARRNSRTSTRPLWGLASGVRKASAADVGSRPLISAGAGPPVLLPQEAASRLGGQQVDHPHDGRHRAVVFFRLHHPDMADVGIAGLEGRRCLAFDMLLQRPIRDFADHRVLHGCWS